MHYTIDPCTPFLLDPIKVGGSEAIEIANKTWRDGEKLYLGKVPKELLSFDNDGEIISQTDAYFHKKKYASNIDDLPEVDRGLDPDMELFAKFVWLFNEHRNKGFYNPIGVHYNPRAQTHVIHPGGCRNKVLKLFHEGPIYSIYFTTNNYFEPWLTDLTPVTIEQFNNQHPGTLVLVPDHGALIPHFLVDTNIIPDGIITWHKKIQSRLESLSIKTNVRLRWLEPWVRKNANVEIECTDQAEDIDHVKALVHILSGLEYTSDTITVRNK